MKTLFFSDAHLDANAGMEGRTGRFIRFLRRIDPTQTERIVLLGDLFDFWFEYKHVIFSGYFDVLRAFADLRDAGVEMHFVCGNHDFWAGRFLSDNLDFIIHKDAAVLELAGKRVLMVHGDGVNKSDWGYRVYKRFARARPIVWLFSLLHPDWAMAIARAVSHGSRSLSQVDDIAAGSEARALREFAREQLASGGVDVVICGHSHHPVCEEHPTPDGAGLYLNTGDWLLHQSYVVWDGQSFRIELFPDQSPHEIARGESGPGGDEK